ncbi:MAG: AAA family ATPase [Candidatus Poribacteria bacterium]|nr:AAA family ATPase [Candidatus Poribacteria bacterium]
MSSYFIESFKIEKLWGHRDIALTFKKDVNILIGPNGSGKTTILNLLNSILSLDISGILNVNFEFAEIHLRDFKNSSVLRTVKVHAANRLLRLELDEEEIGFDTESITGRRFTEHHGWLEKGNTLPERLPERFVRRTVVSEKFYDELTTLVPLVWLPVSRRLPVTKYEEKWHTRTEPLESVDLRLEELLEDISRYHSILNAQLSERYREFEHQVLSMILYSKEHDQLKSIRNSVFHSLPTEVEKDQLLDAFEDAGFLDEVMQSRIDDHFAALTVAEQVFVRIHEGKDIPAEFEDIFVIPLIGRTKAMVAYAKKLEKDKEDIFTSLRRYEEIVNSFLSNKSIKFDERGYLKIETSSPADINPRLLSSGEKQILIFLTEALLRIEKPVVYVADEPELSLHVTWQEKLLKSLVTLGGQMQVIVATHSPDIVGKFQDKVIDLGRES